MVSTKKLEEELAMDVSTINNELRSLIMRYITGNLEEKQFLTAYRRLVRLHALLRR